MYRSTADTAGFISLLNRREDNLEDKHFKEQIYMAF